jgi:hypothetical protein
MMNPIKSFGAAVVALAAPALFSLPAAADTRSVAKVETRIGDDTRLTLAIGSDGYDDHRRGDSYRDGDYRRFNQWGQTDREVRQLRRDAEQACRQAVRYEARELGFYDVDIDDDFHVRQIGRFGFFVNFDDVEFEGRRRQHETQVGCEVRRGSVVDLDGIPRPHRGKGYGRDW